VFETRITKMFGIKYPIIQGGMVYLSRAGLVAAVSNAGGLGILTSANISSREAFRAELRQVKSLTDKPFGVNINLSPTQRCVDNAAYIDLLIEEGVRIVETSGRSPEPVMKQLKDGGVKVIHKAPGGVKFAQIAETIGCDAVSIIGMECGGHPGPGDTGSLVLTRATVQQLKIPVVAGGGFADAEGFVAALALGAEGVLMGTRFMATQECPAHPRFKDWLLRATERDILVTQRSIRMPSRALRNSAAMKVLELENKGATVEELIMYTCGVKSQKVYFDGDLEAGIAECGEVVGIIHDIPTCKELIDGIINGAEDIINKRLRPMVK
jgi:NADH:quinone reductase (non-electrogenic)